MNGHPINFVDTLIPCILMYFPAPLPSILSILPLPTGLLLFEAANKASGMTVKAFLLQNVFEVTQEDIRSTPESHCLTVLNTPFTMSKNIFVVHNLPIWMRYCNVFNLKYLYTLVLCILWPSSVLPNGSVLQNRIISQNLKTLFRKAVAKSDIISLPSCMIRLWTSFWAAGWLEKGLKSIWKSKKCGKQLMAFILKFKGRLTEVCRRLHIEGGLIETATYRVSSGHNDWIWWGKSFFPLWVRHRRASSGYPPNSCLWDAWAETWNEDD